MVAMLMSPSTLEVHATLSYIVRCWLKKKKKSKFSETLPTTPIFSLNINLLIEITGTINKLLKVVLYLFFSYTIKL
jgi:hypothetical protein